jgi:hypothetical protein
VSPIKKQEANEKEYNTPDHGRTRRAAARRSDAARQRFVHRIRRHGDAADSDESMGAPPARTPVRPRTLALRPSADADRIACCTMEWGVKVSRTRVTRPRNEGLAFTAADTLYVALTIFMLRVCYVVDFICTAFPRCFQ